MTKDIRSGWTRKMFYIGMWGMPPRLVTGLARGGLGLFFERNVGRWNLTHLGTGARVVWMVRRMNRERAVQIASEILSLGQWGWSGIDGWKDRDPDFGKKIAAYIDANPDKVMSYRGGSPFITPEVASEVARLQK